MKKIGLFGIIAGLTLLGQALPQSSEVKVALVLPFTGPFAELAKDMRQGFELGLSEANFQAGGRKINLVAIEDSRFTPEGALEKTRKVVEQDGAEIVVGPIAGPEALPMRDYLLEKKKLFLMTYAGTRALTTGEKCSPYLFSTSQNGYVLNYAAGRWLAGNVGKTAYVVLASQYALDEFVQFLQAGFTEAGGQIVGLKIVTPSPQNLAPILAEIAQIKPALVINGVGGDFVKLFHEAGLDKTIKLAGGDDVVGHANLTTLNQLGDSRIGFIFANFWTPGLQNQTTANFLKAYRGKFNAEPSTPSMIAYDAARMLVQTLEATKGNSDVEVMRRALEKLTIQSPRGTIRFDQNHMVVQPMYIFEVQKVDGKLTLVTKANLGPQTSADFGCKGSASK